MHAKYMVEFIYSHKYNRQRKVAILWVLNSFLVVPKKSIHFAKQTIEFFTIKFFPNIAIKLPFPKQGSIFNRKLRCRRYLTSNLTIDGFATELKKRKVDYVFLRWFEDLPFIQKGEDIDLLVSDSDLDTISDLFGFNANNQAFDVYSVSGRPGSDYKNIPYYPPHLARDILANRQLIKNKYSVPSKKYYFLSLAYHAIFHKGCKSGIPNRKHTNIVNADHNYINKLRTLAVEIGIKPNFKDFHDIFIILSSHGWVPEIDTLRFLSRNDPWIGEYLPKSNFSPNDGEMLVFLVREWAILNHKLEVIVDLLKNSSLEIVLIKYLTEDEKLQCAKWARGGKWDKGPYPVSGGLPVVVIVCHDYHPIPPSKKTLKKYPFCKNQRIFVKHYIRDYLNAELPVWSHTNCIHSADDELEAWQYLMKVLPSSVPDIRKKIEYRRQVYHTNFQVLYSYSSNRTRAKIEKIDYHGKLAVKKTFKCGQERFAEREAFVYSNYHNLLHTIPPLLEKKENYIIIPLYENILENLSKSKKNMLLKPHAKTIIDTMRFFFDHGYALIGFYPGNILITPLKKVLIIDFEFLYKYKIKPNSFNLSYDIVGIPADFDGDRPLGLKNKGHTYNNTWRPIFGPLKFYDLQ